MRLRRRSREMARKITLSDIYETIARSLREFGYPDATAATVRETHAAMKSGEGIPHGIVGRFAEGQLIDYGNELDRLEER